jgi:hypothetical protein
MPTMASQTAAGDDTVSSPARPTTHRQSFWSGDVAILVYLAMATVLVHALTGGRYGFHRDELATLEDSRHLAWGYPAYPPLTPLFGRLSLLLFGTSLAGFRFFAALAQAIVLVLTGLMVRELGGRRGAQLVAAAAVAPFCIGAGAMMQYVSFDCLFWVLTAYFVLRLLKSYDPRWWIAIGCAVGLGLQTKYTILFFVAGLIVGVSATQARWYLACKWFWYGVATALLIFLPNFLWQAQHGFVSLAFLRHIHERDISLGRTQGFLADQLRITLLSFPLWMAGVGYYFFSRPPARYRALGWMYVIPSLLFVLAKGRGYYLAPAYPMLFAAGSVWGEQWRASLRRPWALAVRASVRVALVAGIIGVAAITLPLAPINSPWWRVANAKNGDLREEIGWPELVETVAGIRDSLPPQDRARLGVLVGNYGEGGALNLYGPKYGLPRAISGINSFWQRGYGDPPPQTLIVVGISRGFLDHHFTGCELAGHTWNRYGVENEETQDHPDIFVCRGLLDGSWAEFWKNFQYFG